ncbi:unnamed protein product [Darwinula stevensoni]|uniref:Sushi domain-containing protein n=1 Tax=Darwinula stevensoni TaxID=69355 RepID=A0A7R9AHL9_9CRUS|nr:unnamed protein product [Darwinula stevensoni]CAG0904901.1 unnamed protein product [Darwinula stevensoni]
MEFETSGETLTLSCLETGEWEPLEKCIWVECLGDPVLPSMYFISNWDGTSRKVGTTFQYMCLIAFQTTVVGRCEETGKWSSPPLLDCDRHYLLRRESEKREGKNSSANGLVIRAKGKVERTPEGGEMDICVGRGSAKVDRCIERGKEGKKESDQEPTPAIQRQQGRGLKFWGSCRTLPLWRGSGTDYAVSGTIS